MQKTLAEKTLLIEALKSSFKSASAAINDQIKSESNLESRCALIINKIDMIKAYVFDVDSIMQR
jgi:hypothetical protein